MMGENERRGPTVRVIMNTPARRTCELRIDSEELVGDEALARRAEIRQCQREHLSAGTGGSCLAMDCPYDHGECAEVATDWLVAHREDEALARELADDPTRGRDPHLVTSLVSSERCWMRIARSIPALRSLAFARLRGYELVVHRDEVFRLAMETGTKEAFDGLLRMLRVTGLEVPRELRLKLKGSLAIAGVELDAWEGLLEPEEFNCEELSPAMLVARDYAALAASQQRTGWDQEEYWLLGILRVVQDDPVDHEGLRSHAFSERELRAFDEDVEAVRELLAARKLNAKLLRMELWHVLERVPAHGYRARLRLWETMRERAELHGDEGVWARDVVEHALRFPSDATKLALDEYVNHYVLRRD